MKRILLLGLILFPILCHAQSKSGYAQIAFDASIVKKLNHGFGGSFMIGHYIGNSSLGAGFDMIKFKSLDKVSVALYGDFRFHMGKGNKKPVPYFTLTPGYFIYNDNTQAGTELLQNKGGFMIGTGFGCVLYSGHRTAPYLSAVYNNFPIKTFISDDLVSKQNFDVFKLSFGIKF